MKNIILKNTLKEMRKTKSRFLSIFGIVAIGTSFFTGITSAAPDMRLSADTYYDSHSLMDYRLVSTLGFSEKDIEALEGLDNINVYPAYFTDVYVTGDENEKVARIYSLDNTGDNNPYSSIEIKDGRFPEKTDECIVDAGKVAGNYSIGSKIKLASGNDKELSETLEYSEYTVVGNFKSPMYISDIEKGSTSIGNGSVAMLLYIPAESFKTEVYTQVYITSDELKNYVCYDSAYTDKSDELRKAIEKIAKKRQKERFEELTGDPRKKLEDGQAELDKQKEEAEKQFEAAQKQIDEGIEELEDKKAETKKLFDEAEEKYSEGYSEYLTKKLDAYKMLDDAQKEIDKGKEELENQKKEAEKKFEDAQKEIDDARAQLDDARLKLALGKIQLDEAKDKLTAAQSQISLLETMLSIANNTYEQALASGDISDELLENIKSTLDKYQEDFDKAKKEYEDGLTLYNDSLEEYYKNEIAVENAEAKYNSGISELSANKLFAQQQFAAAQDKLTTSQITLDTKRKEAEEQISQGEKTLKESRKQIDSQKETAEKEFDKAQKKIDDGQKELDEKKADAEKKFKDAQQEIDDGMAELVKVNTPEWYIFTRNDNPGYEEYGQNADRIANIALVFPVFFIMVAALVCLTTMTRMVEEQRTQSGTFKALGFGSGTIMSEYLIYAVSAATLGAIIGMLFGMKFFPIVIIVAYGMMYNIPDVVMPYDIPLMVITTIIAAVLVLVTVYFSCKNIIKEQPASLMRPKAPKLGKPILLERIDFIWKHFSFTLKVTIRNIFRYKRRMLMTVIGISGCTALVLTGFGLHNSISDIVYKQFDKISTYAGMAIYNDISDENLKLMADNLEKIDFIGDNIYQKQIDVKMGSKSNSCTIMICEDDDVISKYMLLNDRISGVQYHLDDEGVILNEKLAQLIGGAKVGDTVELAISDTKTVNAKISAICENYANHYLYMTRSLYEELLDEKIVYNTYIFNSKDNTDEFSEEYRDEVSTMLLEIDGVIAVSFKTAVEGTFSRMLGSLSFVIIVLIASAGLLALIVLYNLTNININERIREIATLKVLGQYDREVSAYVFREIIFLTLLGTGAGILLGRLLLDFVVKTAEINLVMFGRDVHFLSYVFAVAITLVFAGIVMLIMHRKLAKINMVEALKSIE